MTLSLSHVILPILALRVPEYLLLVVGKEREKREGERQEGDEKREEKKKKIAWLAAPPIKSKFHLTRIQLIRFSFPPYLNCCG